MCKDRTNILIFALKIMLFSIKTHILCANDTKLPKVCAHGDFTGRK